MIVIAVFGMEAVKLSENCSPDYLYIYNEIVVVLNTGIKLYVPSRQKHLYRWKTEHMKRCSY